MPSYWCRHAPPVDCSVLLLDWDNEARGEARVQIRDEQCTLISLEPHNQRDGKRQVMGRKSSIYALIMTLTER